MKKSVTMCVAIAAVFAISGVAQADLFGIGANQFAIDFVPISGATNPTSGIPAGGGFAGDDFIFTGVNNDYRMGTYEITNAQWDKFKANIAPMQVTGNPSGAYDSDPYWPGSSVPTNNVSWHEAAQFTNWLNTSKGYQAAYKFTGTQGTSDYTLDVWSASDAGYNAANPYRNSNAIYFMPTENEWVKAAYWNGMSLQTYATKAGESLYQGNGSNGGWNYFNNEFATDPYGPWAVGSGSQELNGTFDMMGNVWEWMESPWASGDYLYGSSFRGVRGGSYGHPGLDVDLASSTRYIVNPDYEDDIIGFRVASVPEPASLVLLGLGGLVIARRRCQ